MKDVRETHLSQTAVRWLWWWGGIRDSVTAGMTARKGENYHCELPV